MKIYYGGQILEECRGKLAVVIAKSQSEPSRFDRFMYPIDSDEFMHLTGVRDAKYPNERVYIGVSNEAGENIMHYVGNKTREELDLRSLDNLVVYGFFVQRDKRTITLELSDGNCRVVEEK